MSTKNFNVGDFITADPWDFPLKITKLDSGNGQFETVKADGYHDKDIYYIVPERAVLFEKTPEFKIGDKIKIPTTQQGQGLSGSAKTLIEKSNNENLGYLEVTEVTYNRYDDEKFAYWLGFLDIPSASVSFNDEDSLELYKDPFETKFKAGQIVVIKGRPEKYIIKDKVIKQKDGIQIYEGEDTVTGTLFPLVENTLELAIEQPKFKIGDKVKIPKTRWGTPIEDFDFSFIENAKKNNQDFLYVVDVTIGKEGEIYKVWLSDSEQGEDDVSFKMTDNIELYEETPETPEPKFKVGDIVKPIDSKQNRKYEVLKVEFGVDEYVYDCLRVGTDGYVVYTESELELYEETPDKLEPKFKVGEFVKVGSDTIYQIIRIDINENTGRIDYGVKTTYTDVVYRKESDLQKTEQPKFKKSDIVKYITDNGKKYKIQFITYQSDKYIAQLEQIDGTEFIGASENDIELVEDCKADPSLIVSEQVKKFYDLNQTRIEKLKSEFSCKIIKALVSLSDYEKCGTPSKIKLPSSKEDLLSKIQNLKF